MVDPGHGLRWRPYVAVIADSFHAAFASRVLWAALCAIWVLLASLAPIGLREDYTTRLRDFDVYNGTRMKALLSQGIVDPQRKDAPIGRLAAAMPDELKRKFKQVGEGEEVRIVISLMTDALNDLMQADATAAENASSGWYDAAAWKTLPLTGELRQLNDKPQAELSASQNLRRSRLRVEAALPGVFESRSPRSVSLTYGGLEFPTGLEIDKSQFRTIFNQFVIPTLVHWLLGFVLVFLGVLVTASIIPDMLQAGSLHLLLSKPISRAGLLISKFIGGCAFVTVCVLQIVVGLFLIAGLRLDIWNPRILWCVPVAVFMFAVFFSVSVAAGLKWRSPILSIAAAGALAALCVVVGVVSGLLSARIIEPARVIGLAVAGADVFATTSGGGVMHWEGKSDAWSPLIPSEAFSNDRILSPIAIDPDHVLTSRIRNGKFSPFGSGPLDLTVLSRPDAWRPEPGIRLPTATERLVQLADGDVLAVHSADLLRTTTDIALGKSPASATGSAAPRGDTLSSWLGNLITMQGGATEGFSSILPKNFAISMPVRVAVAGTDGGLVIATGNRLTRLTPGAQKSDAWVIASQIDLDRVSGDASIVLAASRELVFLGRGADALEWLDTNTLKSLGKLQVPDVISGGRILELVALADRVCLLRMADGTCHRLTWQSDAAKTPELETFGVAGAEAVAIDEQGKIWVAHHTDQLAVFDPESPRTCLVRFRPKLTSWRWIEKYVMGTVGWITPQVLQLGETTASMVSGNQTFLMEGAESGGSEVVRYRTYGPLISCGLFIAAVMTVSSWYFCRTDF